jgi:putative aldouronate transport system substrate-binding protein
LPTTDKLGSPDHPRGWKTIFPDLPAGYPIKDPITITCSRRLDQQTRFCGDDDFDNNPWTRMCEALFGIRFQAAWTWSTGDEANQKYNLALASGDMPDYMETVPLTIYVKMVESGALRDVTDDYDMYASPRWKAIWREFGELPWVWTRVNGRIYGIPRPNDLSHDDCVLWYRADWMEKLGLKVPETHEELHDVAKAFMEADMGQGAEGTTQGLMATQSFYATWYGSLDPLWGNFGYIPTYWSKEGDDLMYNITRPEIAEALEMFRQWYDEGIFRKDFYTINTSQGMSDVAANTVGLHFTPPWGANRDSVVNDPECRWAFTNQPVGPKGFRRRATINPFTQSPMCFRKGFEDVKPIFDYTDWWDDLWRSPWRRMHGWEGCNYAWEGDKVVPTGVGFQNWTIGPVGTRGSGMLDPRAIGNIYRYNLDEWGKIPPEKWDAQQELFFQDPTGTALLGAQSRLYILETAGQGVIDEFQRLPTQTMIERGVDLAKLRDESILAFFIGQRPLSEFDQFVNQYNELGGAKVTEEVNEWWHSR